MSSPYFAFGTDLDTLFKPRSGADPQAANTGYSIDGVDLAARYYPSTSTADRIVSATGYGVAGADLRTIFRNINFAAGPTITTQPVAVTINVGQSITFTLAAEGTEPITCQWQRDVGAGWVNVNSEDSFRGGISNSFYIAVAVQGDQGSYRCVVSDAVGSTTTSTVTATVNYSPTVAVAPMGGTYNEGNSVSLWITVNNGQPSSTSYQWRRNGSNLGSEGGKYSGFTSSNLIFLCDYTDHNGSFDVVVSNSAGQNTSAPAVLDVHFVPRFLSQPQGFTTSVGGYISLAVSVLGNTSPTYQWRLGGADITGATNSFYTKSNAQVSDAGSYTCAATNDRGTTVSSAASVQIEAAPVITGGTVTGGSGGSPPSGGGTYDFSVGNVASFTVEATGNVSYYQWYKNGQTTWLHGGVTVGPFTETQGPSYECDENDAGVYAVAVIGPGGTVGAQATLTVSE